jgi:hypothetical protein
MEVVNNGGGEEVVCPVYSLGDAGLEVSRLPVFGDLKSLSSGRGSWAGQFDGG